ncbi:MAG TPA: energy transducer TonB [Bryobacteraceae bacterium]|jgi:TonB family protein
MDQKTEERPVIETVDLEGDTHLEHLLLKQEPFLQSAIRNVKEYFNPPKLPPLELTSQPIPVKDIWGQTRGNGSKAGVLSAFAHVAVVILALVIGTNPTIQKMVKDKVSLIAPISPYEPVKPKKDLSGGGGGGGSKAPTPVSQGKAPKMAPKQFVPPMIAQVEHPKIAILPTINADVPQINAENYGDPLSKLNLPSNGIGTGAGMGSGSGGGLGSGRGGGFGPGSGGGVGGGAYRIGGGVSAPKVIFQVEPEYSEDARKAKFQGTVVIALVVDEKGNPRDIRVVRPLGMGLDQKAIEAVEKWRFRPGQKDGKAVATQATIEVSFRLL